MFRIAIAFATLVHLVAFWLAFPRGAAMQQSMKVIEVAVKPRAKSDRTSSNQTGRIKKRTGFPKLSFSDLGIAPSRGSALNEIEAEGDSNLPAILHSAKSTVISDFLYRKLDASLTYPSELHERDIEGKVFVTLVFSESGDWIRSESRIRSASAYLRVHIARLLRNTLEKPVPPSYLKNSRRRFHCIFEFEKTRTQDPLERSEVPLRNRLNAPFYFYFYRAARLVGEWKLGPLHGYAFAPAVGIDLETLTTSVTDAVTGKEHVDALELYRLDPAWSQFD